MKRFSKILVAVLALCLLVGVLALAISANYDDPSFDGKQFVVKGVGYDTWEAALAASVNAEKPDEPYTIYLNKEWTLDTGLTLSGENTNVKVNLNGKTVSTEDGSKLFNVINGAELTIEGEGTIDNNGEIVIGSNSSATVTIDATGSGIVINNNASGVSVNAFRFYSGSTLNVYGALVVNTNASATNRCIFNVSSNGTGTTGAILNIKDAKVTYAKPSIASDASPKSGLVMDITDATVTVDNSEITTYYGYIFQNSGTAIVPMDGDGNKLVEADDTLGFKWSDEAYAKKNISFAKNNRTVLNVTNSTISSLLDGYAETFPYTYSFANVGGNIKANFKNSNLFATHRWFGNGVGSLDNGDGKISTGLLYFEDCNLVYTGEAASQTSNTLATYGTNFKIIGGSVHGVSLGAGQMPYIALVDSEGKETGEWVGAYVDNVLFEKPITSQTKVHNWAYCFDVNPNATAVNQTVTLLVGDEIKQFKGGYFSDMDMYNAYVNAGVDTYLYGYFTGDEITQTGDFVKNSSGTTGTIVQSGFSVGTPKAGEISSVRDSKGNGYIKYTNATSGSYGYFQTPTNAAGSIITNDAFVIEFDVSTETGNYSPINWAVQGREKMPRYDASGKYLGYSDSALVLNQLDWTPSSSMAISSGNVFSNNQKTAKLATESGAWNRITVIIDFDDKGVLEEISVPAYVLSGTKFELVEGATAKVNATKLTKYDVHVYVNGEYLSTTSYDVTTVGYDGYIPEGAEDKFYIDGLRMTYTDVADQDNTTCIDNLRVLTFSDAQKVDLCYLDENSKPKASISDLDFDFVAEVDGVKYASEAGAIAAIKEDSVVKLLANFESLIEANTAFKLETNGFAVPGFVSATHKPVYYTALGFYKLVKADEGEIYTVNYKFYDQTQSQKVAMGTVIPEMTIPFTPELEGLSLISVTGWTLPVNIPDDYNLKDNVINATAKTEAGEVSILAGGVNYETLADAVAGANGATITLYKDLTVDAAITVAGENTNVKVNLNGRTVSVTNGSKLFSVQTKAKLTIEGEGTLNNSGLVLISGTGYAEVTVDATGAGIVINNNATSGDVNTFRFDNYSTLNVYGKIVVNTNGVTTTRAIFNVSDSSKRTVNLNIKDADILYATPSVTGAPAGKVIASQFSKVNIESSRLEGVYSIVIYSSTTGSVTINDANQTYIIDKDSSDAVSYGWDPNKLEEAKSKLKITINENYTVSDSVLASTVDVDTNYIGSKEYTMQITGATKADFTNCEIYGNTRIINGGQSNSSWDKTPTSKSTDASQITFVDCHIRACKNGSISYLFCYGPNVRFLGGSIGGGTFATCQPHYIELDAALTTGANGETLTHQWLGVYVDNVLGVSGLKGDDAVINGAWVNSAKINPDSTINGTLPVPVTIVVGGESETFKNGCFSDESKYSAYLPFGSIAISNGIYSMSDGNVAGADFFMPDQGTASGTKNFSNLSIGNERGIWESAIEASGNGYMKHSLNLSESADDVASTNYSSISTGSTTGSFSATAQAWDATGRYSLMDYPQVVFEFDVRSDTGYFPYVPFKTETRVAAPVYNADGTVASAKSGYEGAPCNTTFSLLNQSIGSVNFASTLTEWHRVTLIYDVKWTEVENVTGSMYYGGKAVATIPDGLEKPGYSFLESKLHIYIDGTYIETSDFVSESDLFGGALPKEVADSFYILQQRIAPRFYGGKDCSWSIDNIRVSRYDGTLDLGFYDENTDSGVKTSLAGLDHFLLMPDNNTTIFKYVAKVDGVNYVSEAEALAAIKEGSTIELLSDFKSAIEAKVSFKLITNDFKYPGFVSETHKIVDYSGTGFYKLVKASENEIFVIVYPEYKGVSGTQTAVLGSLLKAPAEFDKVSAILDEEAKEYQAILSWSLSENEDVFVVTGPGVAYPKVDKVKAVVVYWKDANGELLDTDFYFPGEFTVLPDFDGEDVPVDYSKNDYYGVARTGWEGIDDVNLAVPGDYTITAEMGKVAPETFPGLKYNLSLYSNYVMNFYVPSKIEGVTNLTVSRFEDGSISISHFEPGTLGGVEVEKYGYMLGLGDIEMQTFYVVYYVDGEKISFPVYVSVPDYVSAVMAIYDEDTSAKGEATKALIVNMLNYATKVFALNPEFDNNSTGAQTYADILAEYGAEYLSYYEGLTNDRFKAGGDLYALHGVAALNWVTGTDESNAEALSYIGSIGFDFNTFEPAFLVKFSETAITKGLQAPDSKGLTCYNKTGLYVNMGAAGELATEAWAEKGDDKYYGETNIWATLDEDGVAKSNGDRSYEYYARANNSGWDAIGENANYQDLFKVKNIRKDITIKVYWSPDNETTNVIGEVHYNLAAYINYMLANESANAAYIEAARALYAFSCTSEVYGTTK